MTQEEIAKKVQHFIVEDAARDAARPELLAASGRSGRTLAKADGLTLTVLVLGPGGEIPEHSAEGPITVQTISGKIAFSVAGVRYPLGPGELLFVPARLKHSVFSDAGGSFLLTRMVP